jgi:predicted DNA-binding transcriptional regulator YafY
MLNRIYFIDREIASGKFPSTRKLAEMYEAGTATISRDIEFLRDMMGAPIEYDTSRKGYYYSDKSYRLPASFFSAEDMLALGMVKSLLSLYRDTPLYEPAKNLLDSITAPLSLNGQQSAPAETSKVWFEDRVIVPPAPSVPVPPELWTPITGGLRENRIIGFEYQGTWDDEYIPRRVRPYQLLFDNGLWYLYGYAEERQAPRMFSLPRIKNVILTQEAFKLPADFDYRQGSGSLEAGGSYFGVFSGQKNYRFRIAFYEKSVVWVEERVWAADQVISGLTFPGPLLSGNNFGVIISFTSSQYEKVLEWVLSQGCNARPLQPDELVEEWRGIVRKMAEAADR